MEQNDNHTLPINVLFIVFNRPEKTQRVFEAIRRARVGSLFIAADGHRPERIGEAETCAEVKRIVTRVDWPCKVKTLFRNKNLGCKMAVSSAIDWFFENVNEGIILEDDCLPTNSFFEFCQKLLEKYRDNEQVMQINGNYYLDDLKHFNESYYFSKLNGCWGWATWKRAWKHFDKSMSGYNEFKNHNGILKYFKDKEISDWMTSYLDEADTPKCKIWSTQWSYAIIIKNALCITPTKNLVKNIGFDKKGTTGLHKSYLKYTEFDIENIGEIGYDTASPRPLPVPINNVSPEASRISMIALLCNSERFNELVLLNTQSNGI